MIEKQVFALSRLHSGFKGQKWEVICFEGKGIRLGFAPGLQIPFSEIREINFIHAGIQLPGLFESLGIFGSRNAGQFSIKTVKEQFEVSLEWDARFKKAELIHLFSQLYSRGLSFQEWSHNGSRRFLFELLPSDEVEKKIRELKEEYNAISKREER